MIMTFPNALHTVRERRSSQHAALHSTTLKQETIKKALGTAIALWLFTAQAQVFSPFSSTISLKAANDLRVPSEASVLLPTNWNIGLTLGAGFGVKAVGSTEAHHLSAATLHVGKLLTSDSQTLGPLLRHVELAGELCGGAQYHPDTAYLIGLTPLVRYHFWLGARWSPFLEAGAGVNATDIGHPDLSTTFEFSPQAGGGVHWMWCDNLGLTFDARYIHLSNAGIEKPNNGVNTFLFSSGLTWFF
jgi:lipid A 3-O-deacylase